MKTKSTNELIIARFLSISMWLSTVIVLVGMVMLFLMEGHTVVTLGHFQASGPLSSQTAINLAGPSPAKVILAGLILLILTPVMRVALTTILFARERDYVYVAIGCAVLNIVISALLGA